MELAYTELGHDEDYFPALAAMRGDDDEWTVGESSSIASGDMRERERERERSPSVLSAEEGTAGYGKAQ
jgi:hypothetical protein